MPPGPRALTTSLLVVCVLAGGGVLAFGLGIDLPGGSEAIRGAVGAGTVPRAVTVLAYAGSALAVIGFMGAARERGGRLERLTHLVIAVAGAALAGEMVKSGLQFAVFVPEFFPLALPLIILLLAGFAYITMLLLAVIGRWVSRRAPVAAMSLAAAPFLLGLVTYLVAGLLSGERLVVLGPNHPQAVIGASILGLVAVIGLSVTVLFLWQAAVGASAACEAGVAAARRSERWRGFFLVAIFAKLAWLVLGYAGLLPRALGGSAEVWAMSGADGAGGWVLAIAFAIAAVTALAFARRRVIESRSLFVAAALVATGFTAFLSLAAVALLARAAVLPFHAGAAAGLWAASAWLSDHLVPPQIATVFVAVSFGAGLLALRRRQALGALLLTFGLWGLPRATSLVLEGLGVQRADIAWLRPEPVSFDAALTLLVGLLAVAWLFGIQQRIDVWTLTLALAASTAVVHAGTLTSSWSKAVFFYVALVLPVAYQFLFDSTALNRPGDDRARRVLTATALAAGLLTLAVVRLNAGFEGPDRTSEGQLGGLVALPFAAVLVGGAVAARQRAPGTSPVQRA